MQDFALFAYSIKENVIFDGIFDETRFRDCINKSGLKEKISSLPYDINTSLYRELDEEGIEFSGGEGQKLAMARALYKKADIMILDEPTNGLHIKNVRSLLKLLNQMVDEGNSIFVIEHNIEFIKSADYVVELGPEGGDAGGRLLFAGTPSEMKMSEKSVTAEYL